MGRFHTSQETYFGAASQLYPLKHKSGIQTYVMMQAFVFEPILTFTVGLYSSPKIYADQDSVVGETVGLPKTEGFREVQVGNAQAWYYHADRVLMLWECFFDSRFRPHPLEIDENMQRLWRNIEHWLLQRFPQTSVIATPFNDPIARSMEEYQAFLNTLGFAEIDKGVFGKKIHQGKAALT